MQNIPINQIKENPSNPRKIDKLAYQKLLNSIQEFPQMLELRPLVVDKNMVVIGGNMRLKALRELKYEKVPVIMADKLTDDQIKRFVIVDNLPFGEWDYDLLANQYGIEDLESYGMDTKGLGLEVITADEKDDDVPEVPDEPVSKMGDLYEIDGHKIMCGDSIKKEDVERLMGGVQADMVFTDPPYNVNYESSSGMKIQNDQKGDSEFLSFLQDSFLNVADIMKSGASIYVCHADLEGLNFRRAFKEAGFKLSATIVWNKNSLVMGRSDYQWKHEPILYGWKEGSSHTWYGDRKQTTVWDIQKPNKNDKHPTMKPVELVASAIVNSSKGDDIIFDPFLGSGTTCIASEKTGRKCYGMEIDPKYVDVCVSRMCEFTGNYEIIKNGKKLTWKK